MLTSLNAFGGLSAADLLRLLGANSPSSASSPSAKSSSAAQSTTASARASSDPFKTIKDILAGAQMEQRSPTPSAGGSVSEVLVAAAYAEQTGSGYALAFGGAKNSGVWGGSERTFAAQLQTGTPGGDSAVELAGVSFQSSSFYNGGGVSSDSVSFHSSVLAASVTTLSASQAAGGAPSSPATARTDVFSLSNSVGAQSVATTFAVGGLGQPQAVSSLDWTSGNAVCSVGQGGLMETFSIAIQNGDSTQSTSLTIGGLNMAQAQQLQASFENAAPAPIGHDALVATATGADAGPDSAWFASTVSYFSGVSIRFGAQISAGWPQMGQQSQA